MQIEDGLWGTPAFQGLGDEEDLAVKCEVEGKLSAMSWKPGCVSRWREC